MNLTPTPPVTGVSARDVRVYPATCVTVLELVSTDVVLKNPDAVIVRRSTRMLPTVMIRDVSRVGNGLAEPVGFWFGG